MSVRYLVVHLLLLILFTTRRCIPGKCLRNLKKVQTTAPMLPTGVRCIMVLTLI